ncbi:unnamed protein product [Toxocara canis]|uniref:FERM domain-containing protein n=1 Tax=Toxocara canis TaxID=6265 RepID=A0A183V2T2_TOXCA|nr:unnamed protein product [Toxocara canis]
MFRFCIICFKDVISSLAEKLRLTCVDYFSLVLETSHGSRSSRFSLLANEQKLCDVAARPCSGKARCLFRVVFVPREAVSLYARDPNAFEYFYQQCVADVVSGRFACEMRYEACIRLAALHLRQVALDTNCFKEGRVSVSKLEYVFDFSSFNYFYAKLFPSAFTDLQWRLNIEVMVVAEPTPEELTIDRGENWGETIPSCFYVAQRKAAIFNEITYRKEYGLENFLPSILLDNVRRRDIKKHLRFYLKKDNNESNSTSSCAFGTCTTSSKPLSVSSSWDSDTRMSLRIKYVQIVSHLPTLGGRCFSVTFKESQTDMIMQVDATAGILVRHPGKSNQPTISIAFELFDALSVVRESDVLRVLVIQLRNNYHQGLEFIVDKDDIDDLILYIKGYYKLAIGCELPCSYCEISLDDSTLGPSAPPYRTIHAVFPAGWNYSIDSSPGEKLVNLSLEPPAYSIAIETCPGIRQQQQYVCLFHSGDSERFSSSSDTEESSCHCSLRDSIKRDKTETRSTRSFDQTSFGANSSDQVPSTNNFAGALNAVRLLLFKDQIEKLLMLIPNAAHTDPDLIDLTVTPLGDENVAYTTFSASDMSSLSPEG